MLHIDKITEKALISFSRNLLMDNDTIIRQIFIKHYKHFVILNISGN